MHMEIAKTSVFECHLGVNGNRKIERQIAIENLYPKIFYLRWSIVLTFSIAAYPV